MKTIEKSVTLSYFSAPSPAELETWCEEHGFSGVFPTQDMQGDDTPSDHVLAAALWYARQKYPDASNLDVCSFAGLVSYLATGWYGGFGTEQYEKERRAENIILALAGGTMSDMEGFWLMPKPFTNDNASSEEFTRRVLSFLETYYFQDEKKAIAELMAKNALDLVRAGELLTVSQVAERYGITKRAVQLAVSEGKLADDETVELPIGFVITRAGAERLWGYRRREE